MENKSEEAKKVAQEKVVAMTNRVEAALYIDNNSIATIKDSILLKKSSV